MAATDNTTYDAQARETIRYYGKAAPEGRTGLTVQDFHEGEVVAIHSRGGWRAAVVTGIKTSRLETVYTTEGSANEAGLWYDRNAEIIAAGLGGKYQQTRNYRTTIEQYHLDYAHQRIDGLTRAEFVAAHIDYTRKAVPAAEAVKLEAAQ